MRRSAKRSRRKPDMTDTKHTPGPWFITKGMTSCYIEARLECGLIQEVAWCGSVLDGDAQANAHLIAAAPDMLTALETVLAGGHLRTGLQAIVANAIAKATGRNVVDVVKGE